MAGKQTLAVAGGTEAAPKRDRTSTEPTPKQYRRSTEAVLVGGAEKRQRTDGEAAEADAAGEPFTNHNTDMCRRGLDRVNWLWYNTAN